MRTGSLLIGLAAGAPAWTAPVLAGGMGVQQATEFYPSSRFGSARNTTEELSQGHYRQSMQSALELWPQTRHPGRNPASLSPPQTIDPFAVRTQSSPGQSVRELSLIITEQGFFPTALLVTREVPVRLFVTSVGERSLCLILAGYPVQREIRVGKVEEIEFTPKASGPIRFYCPINAAEGSFLVKDLEIGGI